MSSGPGRSSRGIRARGIMFLAARRFVSESYGAEAHERVVAALPPDLRASFASLPREAAWKPLGALAAYCTTAARLLAPQDPEFFRRLGRRVGRIEREAGGFAPMVADPATAMRMAPLVWSALYDTGRLELVTDDRQRSRARIHGFKTSRELCSANAGAIEGLCGSDADPVRVEETACILDGQPCCEFSVVWG